jgi:tetratricopeptide (TPR) repeat protein
MPEQPYVSRPEAEAFLDDLDKALKAPAKSPVVFHGWGIGGVGKSTLTRKVKDAQGDAATIAEVSFGLTEGIEEPIPLMAKLYEQIAVKDSWSRDPFWDKYELYFQTIHQLNTQATSGRGDATPEQVGQVKTLLQLGVDVAGEFFLSESGKKTASTLVDKGMEAAVAGLSLKDGLQQLLQQHKATKRDLELQAFMLEPLPHLTRAFAAGLSQHTQHKPIILVLDTYEKAPSVIDTWLWRTLLGNTEVSAQPVRLLITGRHCLLKTEGWRKLHQDRHVVQDLTIERFSPAQTKDYLAQINITDETQVETIGRVTRGLPYYLNWIREQTAKGRTLNFDQGNQEIMRLLLQGLNDTQTRVVQLAACCRWFDAATIRYVAETWGLDFASAVDDSLNCYSWLTQQSFVEPVGKRWRLDDVARDVFRQSLEPDDLETAHEILAQYFLEQSDQEVLPESPPPQKYENPDWRQLRADYLYHLLFIRQSDSHTIFISHLLEARYFSQDELVKIPFQAITAEFELQDHPLLRHSSRQFLQHIRPAVEHGWAVLEENPLDYSYNEAVYGLSETQIDTAVQVCLEQPGKLDGLAKFAGLIYKSGRCPEIGTFNYLQQAQKQATTLVTPIEPDFSSGLFLWHLGNRYYKLGRYEEAIAAYDAALAIQPDDHDALNGKGIALGNLGRYEEAIAAYDAALAIQPDDHDALNNKGVALGNLGRYEEAIAAYDAALAIQPDKHEALYNKGVTLSYLGRYEEAIAAFDAALAIQPDLHEALYNKGIALGKLGRYEEAIAAFDAALAIQPDLHDALNNKGIALGNLGRYEEAIAAYDAALAIQPDKHAAWDNKGYAFATVGQFDEAIACFNQAVAINPQYANAIYNKAFAVSRQGDLDTALSLLKQSFEIDPKYRTMAKTDPDFNPIRHDQRFRALVEGE